MKKIDFVKRIAEYCEFEEQEIQLNTVLKDIDGYDSLAIMSIIAFIDENFNRKVSNKDIENLTDFNSLINLIGEERFD